MRWMGIVLGMVLLFGCDEERDERLVRLSEQSRAAQERQNEVLARQTQQIVTESHELALAAKEVVAADAAARRELVAAQHALNSSLQQQRASVDQQRDALEAERRAIASQRERDPIIAAALHTVGLWLICISPLGLVGYVLFQLGRPVDDNPALGELLIAEFSAERPLVLPAAWEPQRLLPGDNDHPAEQSDTAPPF